MGIEGVYIPSEAVGAVIRVITLVGWLACLVEELDPDAEFGEAHCCGLYAALKPAELLSAIGDVPLSTPAGEAGYGDCWTLDENGLLNEVVEMGV